MITLQQPNCSLCVTAKLFRPICDQQLLLLKQEARDFFQGHRLEMPRIIFCQNHESNLQIQLSGTNNVFYLRELIAYEKYLSSVDDRKRPEELPHLSAFMEISAFLSKRLESSVYLSPNIYFNTFGQFAELVVQARYDVSETEIEETVKNLCKFSPNEADPFYAEEVIRSKILLARHAVNARQPKYYL
ncbi:MAG: hypothetical protein AB3N28_00975 [Kordiimonas sp.]